jgi:hypothetical protein
MEGITDLALAVITKQLAFVDTVAISILYAKVSSLQKVQEKRAGQVAIRFIVPHPTSVGEAKRNMGGKTQHLGESPQSQPTKGFLKCPSEVLIRHSIHEHCPVTEMAQAYALVEQVQMCVEQEDQTVMEGGRTHEGGIGI